MKIIFVCTGNTCRSPMAEYYLKSKNLDNTNVCSRGFSSGEYANQNSTSVMQEFGIDISEHISASITAADINGADAIICMTESHRQMLLLLGAMPNKLHVLGGGVSDPFGYDVEIYRDCRDQIFAAIDVLIDSGFFDDVKVLHATTDDISAIAHIEKECFSTPWSENAISESMKAGTSFYVVKCDNNVAAYMGLSKIMGEGYVTNIAVLPQYRRQGIGKKLLKHVIETTKDELEFISLEVRVSNVAAISLYEKLGFKNVGTRKRFYTNPTEDGIIMTKYFS